MRTKIFILSACFLFSSYELIAQKALPTQVNSLVSKIPFPENCVTSYHNCTIEMDQSNGEVSIKDAGETINSIQSELEKDMKDLTNGAMSNTTSPTLPAVPSADQIEQMKQQAMQMHNMTPEQAMKMSSNRTIQPMDSPEKMKELGNGQNAMMQINLLINELSTKVSSLGGEYKMKLDKVQESPPCPDVKVGAGDAAVPTCACEKERNLEYYNKRVAVRNDYLKQLTMLLQSYVPKIKAQIAIIDDAESDIKYGDGISNPTFKNQAVLLQQQAFGSVPPLIGIVSNALKDSGVEYANIVNTNNGTLIGCSKQ